LHLRQLRYLARRAASSVIKFNMPRLLGTVPASGYVLKSWFLCLVKKATGVRRYFKRPLRAFLALVGWVPKPLGVPNSCAIDKAHSEDYLGRFREILSDPVNLLIERDAKAGSVVDNCVILHTGNVVPVTGPLSYYGRFSEILVLNRGVHEPLEEFVFQELLKILGADPVMLELGAYWGHYSMWLKKKRPLARAWLVEPDYENLKAGQLNFKRNGLEGTFIKAFVGPGSFSIPNFMQENGLHRLTILHCDIQGHETYLLTDCADLLKNQRIDYLFISTHSQVIHERLRAGLKSNNYNVEISSDFDNETTALDGLLFASAPSAKQVFPSLKPFSRNQLPGLFGKKLVERLNDGFFADR
jgi:hypothetical protein